MRKIELTFGIPMFNCEKYIIELINCFDFNNNFDFEVLIVDDGSTDSSFNLLKKCKNTKLRIIRKENGGVSSARNKIITEARGEWLTFIDADDIIDFKKYIYYFNKIKNNSEYAVCINNNKDYVYLTNHYNKAKSYMIENGIINSPCMKFYRTKILRNNKVYFDENISIGEDALFNINYCYYISNIMFFNDVIYDYRRINNNSLTLKYREKKLEELIYVNDKSKLYCKNNEEKKALAYVKLGNCRGCLMDVYRFSDVYDTYVKKLKYLKKLKKASKLDYYILNKWNFTLEYWLWILLPNIILLLIGKIKFFIETKIKKNNYYLANKKIKIGLLTLCGNTNFGNKLQNYALVYYLKKHFFDCETIWIVNPFKDNNIKQFLRFIKRIFSEKIFCDSRKKLFVKFNRFLNIKRVLIFDEDIKKIEKYYDFFLVGSDQVWNYNYFNNSLLYLLSDSPREKNISISASFGIDSIPDNHKEMFVNGLNNFNYISVREDKGKEIIKTLTGREEVDILIDPTMLLSYDEWDIISSRPKQLDNKKEKKYILNYFLGELSISRRMEIERIARENNCYIINLLDKEDPFYNCGPKEFLYLEKNAFLICTDSFHSCVFAILYNKPFIIFDREQKGIENMNSRVDTLIKKFKLKNRRYNGKITRENLEHDYSEAYKVLEIEREKSKRFLEKALDINNKNGD